MLEQTEKVRILTATVEGNVVFWLVERPNGDHYPLTWPVEHFGAAMQFKGPLAVTQIAEFCGDMVGKEMFLKIVSDNDVDIDGKGEDIRG